jgi:hypothetical protein
MEKRKITKPIDLKEGQIWRNNDGASLLISKIALYNGKGAISFICKDGSLYICDYGFALDYLKNRAPIAAYPTWQDAVKNDFNPNL